MVLGRDERVGRDSRQRLPHICSWVAEGFWCPSGAQAGIGLDLGFELVIGEREHAAVGVVDEDDLAGAEEALADGLVIPARRAQGLRLRLVPLDDALDELDLGWPVPLFFVCAEGSTIGTVKGKNYRMSACELGALGAQLPGRIAEPVKGLRARISVTLR